MTNSNTGPITISADSRMSDDFILTSDILVDLKCTAPLAPILMPDGITASLVIVLGQGLNLLYPDTTLQSGWGLQPISGGSSAREVVAGLDANNQVHAFFQDGKNTYHTSLSVDGTWSAPDVFGQSYNLGLARVPLTNALLAYGATPSGDLQLITYNFASGSWNAALCDFNSGLLDAQCALEMTNSTNWTLAAVVNNQLQLFQGKNDSLVSGPETVSTPNPVNTIHLAYEHLGSMMLVFSDTKNNLYTTVAFSDQITQIPGTQIVQGAGLYNTYLSFYGVDGDGGLWVLHQTGWDSSQAPVWSQIFPLDTAVALVAAPISSQSTYTLYAAGIDATLHVLSQDAKTQQWSRIKVQQPSGEIPYELSRFRTQLSVVDSNYLPAANVAVDISAATETAILIAGSTYFIGPGQGQTASVITDASGVITLSSLVTSLSSPTYTVSANGLSRPLAVQPNQYITDFLSGISAVNTGSANIPAMSAETLVNASAQGQLPSGITQDIAGPAAQGIINAINMGTPSATHQSSAGWVLDFSDSANPSFTNFSTQQELSDYLKASMTARPGNSITNFFGDIWHAIERGAMKVTKWVYDAVKKVVTLTVKIGEELQQLGDLIVTGIRDAISIVHSIFQAIGAKVEDVIKWVQDIFSWTDIWNTTLVFEHISTCRR